MSFSIRAKGVSLLEIAIVIAIFAIVSAGVTSLSLKVIDSQRDEATIADQNHIYNSIQDDLRSDLRSATAVWISNGGAAPAIAGNNYVVLAVCNTPPANPSGDTLDIMVQAGYNPAGPTTSFRFVRYQFITIGGNPSLIRLVDDTVAIPAEPGDIWPRRYSIDPAVVDPIATHGSWPSYVSLANIDANNDYKIYNHPDSAARELQAILATGGTEFTAQYGEAYQPPPQCDEAPMNAWHPGSTFCGFYLKSISVNGLQVQAQGYQSRYDKLFGKANLFAPQITFEINPSLKFF